MGHGLADDELEGIFHRYANACTSCMNARQFSGAMAALAAAASVPVEELNRWLVTAELIPPNGQLAPLEDLDGCLATAEAADLQVQPTPPSPLLRVQAESVATEADAEEAIARIEETGATEPGAQDALVKI